MIKKYIRRNKIFSNCSKEARTWKYGNKHIIYPELISGYIGL